MRILDSERLLPNPVSPYTTSVFKDYYSEVNMDGDCEMNYAYYGAGPAYWAAALMNLRRATGPQVSNMVQLQIPPMINRGIEPAKAMYSLRPLPHAIASFFGTYLFGFRSNFGDMDPKTRVITNAVSGFKPFVRIDEDRSASIGRLLKRSRGAHFKGAYCHIIPHGSDNAYRVSGTVCGAYDGISKRSSGASWDLEYVNAPDGGRAYAMLSGLRTNWRLAPKTPFQIAEPLWKRLTKMMRAYVGFAVQASGSSPNAGSVSLLTNGAWEQVYAYECYMRPVDYLENLTTYVEGNQGRGIEKIHMADMFDFTTFNKKLHEPVKTWGGAHAKFLANVVTYTKLEFSSLNGTEEKGSITTEIPFVDITQERQVAALAKFKDLVGGFNQVKTDVWATRKNAQYLGEVADVKGVPSHRGSELVSPEDPRFHTYNITKQFVNVFVVNPRNNVPSAADLANLVNLPPPPSRATHADRVKQNKEISLSVETFPREENEDEGLLGKIVLVEVTNTSDSMYLKIVTEDAITRSIPFMPVSPLLVHKFADVAKAHVAACCGAYGYGIPDGCPDTMAKDFVVFNTAPAVNSMVGQERWHVPYKALTGISWQLAVGPVSSTSWQNDSNTPAPNDCIYKAVSNVNPDNRYTMFDMQIRPPTFLPLFMAATVCHKGGSAAFAYELAKGLITHLEVTYSKGVITFTKKPPLWATNESAFYESIIALIRLGMGVDAVTGYVGYSSTTEKSVKEVKTETSASPSDAFWLRLANISGLSSVSDLVTQLGMSAGCVQVPQSVVTAAVTKDPVGFAASMGITVVPLGDGSFLIGSTRYQDRSELTAELVRLGMRVIQEDTANPRNVLTASGICSNDDAIARAKSFGKPFNPLNLIPHIITATTGVVTKVVEKGK